MQIKTQFNLRTEEIMSEMTKTERNEIEFQVTEIMRSATSSEYARYILEQ